MVILTTTVGASPKFPDVGEKDWFYEDVTYFVNKKGIEGMPDGTFQPQATMTKAEFFTILIKTLYGEQEQTTNHWASGYLEKAEEEKIVKQGEYTDYLDIEIKRRDIAKIIKNAFDLTLNGANKETLISSIKDYNKLDNDFREPMLMNVANNIILGYPDGTVRGEKNITRAEAVAILVRAFEPNRRPAVDKPEEPEDNTEIIKKFGYTVPKKLPERMKIEFRDDDLSKDYSELSILIFLQTDLKEQWKITEQVLRSKFNDKVVEKVMKYVKSIDKTHAYKKDYKIFLDKQYIWLSNTIVSCNVQVYDILD